MAVETGLEAEKNIVHSQGVEKGLVSVIIPVYNTELYLTQCMESILGQTYQNIEIIAVDNASTDGSLRILREYAQKDDRVRIVAKKINASAGRSRNIGLDAASGEFIWFVDSDDYAEKNFLEVTVAKLQEYKDINIVQTCYWTFDDFGTDSDTLPYHETKMYTGRELCIFMSDFVGLCGPNVMLWNKLYRREVFDKRRFYEGKAYEDMFMTYMLLYEQKKVLWLNDRLMHWRINVSSGTSRYNYRAFYSDEIKAYVKRLEYFKKNNDDELYRMTLKRIYYISAQHIYLTEQYVDNVTAAKKQVVWLKAVINWAYDELMKYEWPSYTLRRMKSIRHNPVKFGKASVVKKLDFTK